jgi:hypothetical protein
MAWLIPTYGQKLGINLVGADSHSYASNPWMASTLNISLEASFDQAPKTTCSPICKDLPEANVMFALHHRTRPILTRHLSPDLTLSSWDLTWNGAEVSSSWMAASPGRDPSPQGLSSGHPLQLLLPCLWTSGHGHGCEGLSNGS